MIRLALVGDDAEFRPWLRQIAERRWGEVALRVASRGMDSELAALFPNLRELADWEELLSPTVALTDWDVLLCGFAENDALQEERLKKLAALGKPLVIAHPAVGSMLTAYELELQQREGQTRLWPFLPLRNHPLVNVLAGMLADAAASPIGPVEQLTVTRALMQRDRAAVVGQFSRDLDLIRAIAGEIKSVLAMGPARGEGVNAAAAFANLGVQLENAAPLVIRWGIAPGAAAQESALILTGSVGQIVWRLPTWNDPGECVVRIGQQENSLAHPAWDQMEACCDQLAHLLNQAPTQPTWNDAARAIELTEALEKSLSRGRRIEVRTEEAADVDNFKSVMASVGCLFLLLIPLFLLGVALVSKLLKAAGWQGPAWLPDHAWAYLLLIPAAVYLIAQLVIKLALMPPSGKDGEDQK